MMTLFLNSFRRLEIKDSFGAPFSLRTLFKFFFILTLAQLSPSVFSAETFKSFSGVDLNTGKRKTFSASPKGTVLVFLSAKCPCSDSHKSELKALKKAHPQLLFLGVNSNIDEDLKKAKAYFQEVKLGFPVIKDPDAKLAKKIKALKTPHAFFISPKGEILYQGGVTEASDAAEAKDFPLRAALKEWSQNKKISRTKVRGLGCMIRTQKRG